MPGAEPQLPALQGALLPSRHEGERTGGTWGRVSLPRPPGSQTGLAPSLRMPSSCAWTGL